MTWQKVWFVPIPLVGMRAVARKRRIGWQILYRDINGKCYRTWELFKPEIGPRD